MMTTDNWLTVAVAVLSLLGGVISYLIIAKLNAIDAKIDQIPGMGLNIAVMQERQQTHEKRLDQHDRALDDQCDQITSLGKNVAIISMGGKLP